VFGQNSTAGYGGAVYASGHDSTAISHCSFVKNHADDEGGALYLSYSGSTNPHEYIRGCLFVGGESASGSLASTSQMATLEHCSLWQQGDSPFAGDVYVDRTCISRDPLIEDTPSGPIPSARSPLIDAGDPARPPLPQGGPVRDIGARERLTPDPARATVALSLPARARVRETIEYSVSIENLLDERVSGRVLVTVGGHEVGERDVELPPFGRGEQLGTVVVPDSLRARVIPVVARLLGENERLEAVDSVPLGLSGERVLRVPEDHPTVSAALAVAADLDTVLIGPGTRQEQLVIDGLDITLRSAAGPAATVVTNPGHTAIWVRGPARGRIEGLSILDSGGSGDSGGGIRVSSRAAAEIIGNVIQRNRSNGDGGGVHLNLCKGSIIENNVISANDAAYCGGGIYATEGELVVRGNLIEENDARYGGGAYLGCRADVLSNELRSNVASSYGAAPITGGAARTRSTRRGTPTRTMTLIVVRGRTATMGKCIRSRTDSSATARAPGWHLRPR